MAAGTSRSQRQSTTARPPAPRTNRRGPRARPRCVGDRRSQPIGEHRAVEPIPLALKTFAGIVLLLQAEEFGQLRVARRDLFARRVAVIGEVVATAALHAEIDQTAEGRARTLSALGGVNDVQVEDDAGPR